MVHNKQWIIDKSEHLIDATWRSIPISSGILSYQQNLRIQASKDGKILVLGLVWQTDLDKPSIAEVLNQISSDYDLSNLYKEEETWCGRYVVIYHNTILTDAMGTLGCYYSDNTISSSFKLLNDIINTEGTHQWDSQDLQLTEGNIDYFPGVKTKNNNIKRLLPSQIYNFKEKKCTFRPLSISCFTGMTDNAILKKWEELAVNSLKALSNYVAEPIYCEITGGKDSRTSISVFENACDYELMIWDKEERTRVDIVIAKRIAAVLNRKLHILKMQKKEDSPRIAEWDMHCGNLALGRTMYTRHIYDSVSYQPIITVGSNIYELIEDTYAHEFTAADLEEIFATKGAYFKEAMQEWRDLVSKDTINDYIKESIRMYWDLRMGCWLAAKMQALDIADNITRVHLLNCRKHVALLLALSGNMKDNRLWQQMVINDLCPTLKEIPYDVEYESFRVSLKRGLEKVARKMKETLSPRLYNFFKKIFGKILHKF